MKSESAGLSLNAGAEVVESDPEAPTIWYSDPAAEKAEEVRVAVAKVAEEEKVLAGLLQVIDELAEDDEEVKILQIKADKQAEQVSIAQAALAALELEG